MAYKCTNSAFRRLSYVSLLPQEEISVCWLFWVRNRVTRRACEKNRPKCSPTTHFCQNNVRHNFWHGKSRKNFGLLLTVKKTARRKQSPDGRKFAQSGRENWATSVIFNPNFYPKSTIAALAKIGENWRKLAKIGENWPNQVTLKGGYPNKSESMLSRCD